MPNGGIYSLDRIVQEPVRVHDQAMPLTPISKPSKRPADNELYDRGCDLVEAAMAIRNLAEDPATARAVPALLGCIEGALHELGCAVSTLDETARQPMPTAAIAQRLQRGYMNLGLALADAELASTAARGLAGRALAAASSGSPGPAAHISRSFGQLPDTRDSVRPPETG